MVLNLDINDKVQVYIKSTFAQKKGQIIIRENDRIQLLNLLSFQDIDFIIEADSQADCL